MKKMILSLVMLVATTAPALSMTFSQAQQEALYLSDKMAYELNLSSAQYDAVYEINLDYFTALAANDDILGVYWERRNEDLSYVLSTYQYREYQRLEYFLRPVYWQNGFVFRIYSRYADRHKLFFARPTHYATYRGAHARHHNGHVSYYKGRSFNRDRAINRYGAKPAARTVNRPRVTTQRRPTAQPAARPQARVQPQSQRPSLPAQPSGSTHRGGGRR